MKRPTRIQWRSSLPMAPSRHRGYEKNEVHWVDPGPYPIWVGFAPNEKAWRRQMKRQGTPEEPYPTADGHCMFFQNVPKDGRTIILVTLADCRGVHPQSIMGLLVHETTHAWRFIKEHIGERESACEQEAYGMQTMIQGMVSAYERTRGSLLTKYKTPRKKSR